MSIDSQKEAYSVFDRLWPKFFWITIINLCLASILYSVFGSTILNYCFNEENIGIVNSFIKNNNVSSAPELISISNILFVRLMIIISLTSVYCLLFAGLFFSSRNTNLVFLTIMIVAPLLLLYLINPNDRILSNHGLYRSSIAYQIINGKIPPPDPFFSGHPNTSPWGFPWLAAQISRIFNISPYYSFALINTVSLILCIFLIYKVSEQIIKRPKFNNFSVFFSLLATTILSTELGRYLLKTPLFGSYMEYVEYRSLPVIKKFFNINGVPIGLVFYLLSIYLVIKLFTSKRKLPTSIILFISVLLCGFLYAPLVPPLGGSILFTIAVMVIYSIYKKTRIYINSIIYLSITLLIFSGIILPYTSSVSSITDAKMSFFSIPWFFKNLTNMVLNLGPILLILSLLWKKHIKPYVYNEKFLVFSCFTIAPLLAYLSIHVFGFIEYKFLLTGGIGLGIIAGIGLASICQGKYRILVFIIALMLTYPFHSHAYRLYNRYNFPLLPHKKSPIFSENGINLNSNDPDKQSMYTWLRDSTDVDSTAIDSTIYATVLGQRAIYTILDIPENEAVAGIGMSPDLIRTRNGQDIALFNKRQDIVKSIYGYSDRYSLEEIKEILNKEGKFFILVHDKPDLCEKLKSADFIGVFKSKSGKYQIFSPVKVLY